MDPRQPNLAARRYNAAERWIANRRRIQHNKGPKAPNYPYEFVTWNITWNPRTGNRCLGRGTSTR